MMRKLLLLLLFISIGLHAVESVRVGVYDSRPLMYFSDRDEYRGVCIELLEEIATVEGWSLHYTYGTKEEILNGVATGTIDLVAGATPAADSSFALSFATESVITTWSDLYVLQDAEMPRKPEDLHGLTVAYVAQDAYSDTFLALLKQWQVTADLMPVKTYKDAFTAVQQHRADGALVNRFYGPRHYLEYSLRQSPLLMPSMEVSFAVAKDDPLGILVPLSLRLQSFKKRAESPYYRVMKRWVHEAPLTKSPSWFFWFTGSIVLLAILAVNFAAVLEGRLRKQKKELIEDMRNRRKVELEVEKKRSEIEAILNAFPDIIFRMDKDGTFLSYHGETDQLYVTPNKIVGNTLSNTMPPQLAEEAKALITRVLKTHTEHSFRYDLVVLGKKNHYEARISPLDEDRVIAVIRNITSQKVAQEKLEKALSEKDIMLKEIHHRVKNNLQVINSILRLQSYYITDERDQELFLETRNRVLSMSLVHEKLYQSSDLEHINFSEYLRALTYTVIHSFKSPDERFDVEFELCDLEVDITTAVPCGLVVNELVTNALKYGLRGNDDGRLRVKCNLDDDGNCSVIIHDNGPGYPAGFTTESDETLGMQLTAALVEQLHGKLTLGNSNGARAELIFNIRRDL